MKNKLLALWFGVLCLGVMTTFAQPKPVNADEQTRDLKKLFDIGKVEGIQVVIYLKAKDGSLTPVAPTYEFREKDEVKFSLRSNFRGYVYLVNQGSSGKYRLLYPGEKERNLIAPGEEKLFPSSYPIGFDETSGTEIVQVFLSKRRIGFFDRIAKSNGEVLNQSQVTLLQTLWKNGDTSLNGVVKMEAVNTGKRSALRGIQTRDPIFDLEKKATLIARRRSTSTRRNAAQGDNEAMAFSINLKNAGAQ